MRAAALHVTMAFLGLLGCSPPASDNGSSTVALAEDGRRYADLRRRMVQEQLLGPYRGITNARVLAAMETVPRHEFVSAGLRGRAYEDHPLPIGHGQTISARA